MSEYLLDTDISSYIMKRSHEAVLKRLQTVPIGAVAISVITKSELLYGVEVSPRRQQDSLALSEYLRHVEILDFPDEAALHYAQIRAALKEHLLTVGLAVTIQVVANNATPLTGGPSRRAIHPETAASIAGRGCPLNNSLFGFSAHFARSCLSRPGKVG